MTSAPAEAQVVDLSPLDLTARLDDALGLYVRAMNYPPGTARQRGPMWAEHSRRRGWRGVAAVDAQRRWHGVAYGYPGAPGQWWYEEVRRGLLPRRGLDLRRPRVEREWADTWMSDYFELTELHVDPAAQGHGLGEALLRRLLGRATAGTVLLSTPETSHPSRAWALYRRTGFVDVLRDHRFSSDPRPFAVLGRSLPLPPAPDA